MREGRERGRSGKSKEVGGKVWHCVCFQCYRLSKIHENFASEMFSAAPAMKAKLANEG